MGKGKGKNYSTISQDVHEIITRIESDPTDNAVNLEKVDWDVSLTSAGVGERALWPRGINSAAVTTLPTCQGTFLLKVRFPGCCFFYVKHPLIQGKQF